MILEKKSYFVRVCSPLFKILATGLDQTLLISAVGVVVVYI